MSKIEDSIVKNEDPISSFELNVTKPDTWWKKWEVIAQATTKLAWEKTKEEKNKFIELKLEEAKKKPELAEILWNKEYKDLGYRDFLALQDRWFNIDQLFFSKQSFDLWKEIIVNLGNNSQINNKIELSLLLPKEILEVDVDWVKYTRTKDWFFNEEADDILLKIKDGQKIKISKIKDKTKVQEEENGNKKIEDKLVEYRKNKNFKDVLLDRKFEDLTAWDLLNLKRKGLDIGELFLGDNFFSLWKELKINFWKNTKLDWEISLNYILPKEVAEIEVNWNKYTRTSAGFVNIEAEDDFLLAYNDQKIKILKLDNEPKVKEAKEELYNTYKKIRKDEAKKIILDAVEKKSKKLPLPTKDKEDNEIFENSFSWLFGSLIKFFEKIFKWDFFDLFWDNWEISEKIEWNEEDLKAKKIMPLNRILSQWIRRNPATGTTICSVSAREDAARYFNLKLPRWNAIDVQNSYPTDNKDFENCWENNVADVFVKSKSQYWHRALGFRKWNDWYILDPYTTWNNKSPVRLEDYEREVCGTKRMPITKVVFYKSDVRVV